MEVAAINEHFPDRNMELDSSTSQDPGPFHNIQARIPRKVCFSDIIRITWPIVDWVLYLGIFTFAIFLKLKRLKSGLVKSSRLWLFRYRVYFLWNSVSLGQNYIIHLVGQFLDWMLSVSRDTSTLKWLVLPLSLFILIIICMPITCQIFVSALQPVSKIFFLTGHF